MQYTPDYVLDRFAGVLSAQLLSSQTSGTFQINNASANGTQLATMGTGYQVVVTIEDEKILCSAFSVSGSTVTCTIASGGRGYGGTQAATHASLTAIEIHWTKAQADALISHARRFDDDGMIVALGSVVPTVTDANTLTLAGADYTTYFTPGRVILYKISSTWYRATVRSSSFSTDTTVDITGDGLPASGTILSFGFEMSVSTHATMVYDLVKQCAGAPAENPPAGYYWFYLESGSLKMKDSSGTVSTFLTDLTATLTPTGTVAAYIGNTAPSGWLLADGSAVSRATYANLFALMCPSIGTFTITIASPGLVTLNSHGLATGDSVYFTTTGALPTGLAINTRYWIIKNDANSFWLATSLANALADTKITTTGSQSGTHTALSAGYGIGDGTTTFNVPSMKGVVGVGKDQSQTEFAGLAQTGGEKTHVLTTAELASHTHQTQRYTTGAGGMSIAGASESGGAHASIGPVTSSAGSDTGHNNIQPYITFNYIIKT